MKASTPSIVIAIRLRSSRRRAIVQGLAPLGSVPAEAGTLPATVSVIAPRPSIGPDARPARADCLLDP